MSYAAEVLRSGIRRVLVVQALVVVSIAIAWGLFGTGGPGALAALYGGGVAMVVTLLLGLRIQLASDVGATDKARGAAALYLGVLERYAVVLIGVGVGMGVLHLEPLPLILGFASAQTGYLLRLPDRLQAGSPN